MAALPSFQALGTSWQIEIFTPLPHGSLEVIYDDLVGYIEQFEAKYSRFRADSLLSRLNREKVFENPDPEFVDIIKTGMRLFEETGGVFNFLVHDHLVARGYDATYSFTSSASPTTLPSPRAVTISAEKIITPAPIDLGGFGKGYLIDLLALRLKTVHQVPEFLINGGGDIFGTTEYGQPIEIFLQHPIDRAVMIGKTRLINQGFAASSPHQRHWKSQGKTHHHIVSPNEGSLVRDASFILAPTATEADAYATAVLLLDRSTLLQFSDTTDAAILLFDATTSEIENLNRFPFVPL